MTAQSLTLNAKGLYTSWSELSEIPDGALLKADNVEISKDNILEPRRGFDKLHTASSNSGDSVSKIFIYQDRLLAHYGPQGSEDTLAYFDSNGTLQNYSGTYEAPNGAQLRSLEASQNLYLTTASGVQKIDSISGQIASSGAAKGLDLQAAITGSSGFLANDYRVAYRVLWGVKDANDNLILGAPSQRADVKNTSGGTRDVSLSFTIPNEVTSNWLYQVYRSSQVDNSTTDFQPNDELQLVYESNPTSAEITAGTLTITDIIPDSLRGATIYTAASQEGLFNQNEKPPLAKDMASFRDSVFFADIEGKHRYYITILAIGGTDGIQVGDTLSIGAETFTAASSENISNKEFKVFTAGSASQNIKDTAENLTKVINRSSSSVYTYYLSGPDDLPGKILIEEQGTGGSEFAITVSRPESWSPTGIPTSGTASETSTNDKFKNGLMWSKPFEPEAVPLPNQTRVGNQDSAILRVVPLKDSLIIFKEDGIYRLTGYYPIWDIELLDSSARLIGAETAQVLNNQIYCLTDQGVVVVSNSVRIISRPIEQTILNLFAADLDQVRNLSFAAAYETQRKYYLFLPTESTDTSATQAFVYNIFTQTWVRHVKKATTALATTTQLYLGEGNTAIILRDRNSFTFTDYADYKEEKTVTAVSGTTLTLSDITGIQPGSLLYESSSIYSTVEEIDSLNSAVIVSTNPGFSATNMTLYDPIKAEVQWVTSTAGNPGITKQFHTSQLIFRKDFTGTGFMTYETDLSSGQKQVALEGPNIGAWGLFPWGLTPWGGEPLRRPIRQWIPREKQRCSQLRVGFKHSFAYSDWQIQGLSLHFTPGTEKTSR